MNNLRSEKASSTSLHIKTSGQPDNNNLKYSCNDEPKSKYVIPLVYVDIKLHTKSLWGPNPPQELSKLSLNVNSFCHNLLMGTGKVFVINCCNIL